MSTTNKTSSWWFLRESYWIIPVDIPRVPATIDLVTSECCISVLVLNILIYIKRCRIDSSFFWNRSKVIVDIEVHPSLSGISGTSDTSHLPCDISSISITSSTISTMCCTGCYFYHVSWWNTYCWINLYRICSIFWRKPVLITGKLDSIHLLSEKA